MVQDPRFDVVLRLDHATSDLANLANQEGVEPTALILTAEDSPPLEEGTRMAVWQNRISDSTHGWGVITFGVCLGDPDPLVADDARGGSGKRVVGSGGQQWRISMLIRSSVTISDDYSTVWTEPTGVLARIIWSDASYVALDPGTLDRLELRLRRVQSQSDAGHEPWTRDGVEKYVVKHFEGRGFEVEERVDTRDGYDLLVTGANGYRAAVEMKAFVGVPSPSDVERVRSATVIPDLPESISEFLVVAVVIDVETDWVETLLSVDTREATR